MQVETFVNRQFTFLNGNAVKENKFRRPYSPGYARQRLALAEYSLTTRQAIKGKCEKTRPLLCI